MNSFLKGFEKRADDMDMRGPSPSKEEVTAFLKKNPDPVDDEVHDFSEEAGFNNHKTEQKIYELASDKVSAKSG